jgi:hypothetical protein
MYACMSGLGCHVHSLFPVVFFFFSWLHVQQFADLSLTLLLLLFPSLPLRLLFISLMQMHSDGNYCIQHVLDHAPPNVCANIKMKMEGKYVRLAKQKFSSNVVEKCLRTSSYEWRSVIFHELTASVSELIRDRYGNYVLQTAVALADANQVMQFSQAVQPYLNQLRDNVRTKWLKIIKTAGSRQPMSQGSGASSPPFPNKHRV